MGPGEMTTTTPGSTTDHGGTGQALQRPESSQLPLGAVVTASGRISRAEEFREPSRNERPFSPRQLARIDEALTLASRQTGLLFSLYLGDLGQDSSATAARLHSQLDRHAEAILIAVSPGQRIVEVVTGAAARIRVPDQAVQLTVVSMVASFKESDLLGGIINGIRMLADQAGSRPRKR